MAYIPIETIQFPTGDQARLLRVPQYTAARQILKALELPRPRAVLVLNGGTAELEGDLQTKLARLLNDGLVRIAAEEQLTVVTGATEAGIFALLGQGLAQWGRTAPCIGVTVADRVSWPGHPQDDAPSLESHHSHFVLVEGRSWGDETRTMYALIDVLAQECSSIAVFAGGGQIVIQEMKATVVQGREMILLAGSGRTTDRVLAARLGQPTDDPRLLEIAQVGKITSFDINQDPTALRDLVRRSLFQ